MVYIESFCLFSCFFFCSFLGVVVYGLEDFQQGLIYGLLYIHVPTAWWSLVGYSILSSFSLLFLVTRNSWYIRYASIIGLLCFISIFITLLTGSLWGKCSWGTYWQWDARMTAMFVLFLQVFAYFFIKDFIYKSLFAVLGWINIPIVKWSVDWWRTLHQKSSITLRASSVDEHMLFALFLATLFFLFYFIYLFILMYRQSLRLSEK